MFVTLWEFKVKSGLETEFERVYGEGGDWAEFFHLDSSYLGTRLAKDTARARTYFTFDLWTTSEAYERFRQSHAEEYARLDLRCGRLTELERCVSEFDAEM
jgi:heme-degrading monooxygenase HmoA